MVSGSDGDGDDESCADVCFGDVFWLRRKYSNP